MKEPLQHPQTAAAMHTSGAKPVGGAQLRVDGSSRQDLQRGYLRLLRPSARAACAEPSAPFQLSRTSEKKRERQLANQARRAVLRKRLQAKQARDAKRRDERREHAPTERERLRAERELTATSRSLRKRRPPKLEHALPNISGQKQKLYDRLATNDETSWGVRGKGLIIGREGRKGPFDEDFGKEGTLMWRADTRPPKSVLKTGFTTKAERDLGSAATTEDGKPTGNEIVYRTGTEDIVPATGVCLARDVRGASFFPFEASEHDSETQEESAYLYGIRVRQAINTFKAQQVAERRATGKQDWKDRARFVYDPSDEKPDEASAVWPYAEFVTHRVEPQDIVAGYRFKRDRLVAPDRPRIEPKAGIGFSISPRNLIKKDGSRNAIDPLRERADLTALAYSERYPRHPEHYLSYQGTVRRLGKKHPETDQQAATRARQIDALPSARPRPDLKKAERRRKLAEKKERKQRGKPKSGTS